MLGMMRRQRQAGDTLIEVLFAITVLSLVVVMSLALMNQGASASLRSLQITLVRQQMDSQAETLRFLNSAYIAAYSKGYTPSGATSPAGEYYKIIQAVKATGATSATPFGSDTEACPDAPNGSFFLDTSKALYQAKTVNSMAQASSFSQVVSTPSIQSQGLWIEGVRSVVTGGTAYTDFHIRACWGAPGTNAPMTLGTIVRLYEPAS